MEIIIGRQGTQKTKITDPTVSRQHCKVTVNPDGTYTVENLSQHGTKIDGRDILKATAQSGSRIQLGSSYSAVLADLIGATPQQRCTASDRRISTSGTSTPSSQSPQKEIKTFNIAHLKRVWEDFNQTNIEKSNEQRKINLIRTGMGIFTMCAMPLIYFCGPVGYAMTAIGILGNIYSFTGMKNAETAEDRQRRQDEFDDAWVCPNPACGRSLLAKNYKMLLRNHKSCPYCKCKYVEK